MGLDFPASPNNGDTYNNYYYDSSIGAWRSNGSTTALGTRVTALEVAGTTTNRSGLVPVTPTSVVVGSGSATVTANGLITLSSVSSISLNSVFTSTYQDYFIKVDLNFSTNTAPNVRLRAAGTDTTSGYWSGRLYQIDGTIGGQNNSTNATWGLTATAVQKYYGNMTMYKPFAINNTYSHHSIFAITGASDATVIAEQQATQAYLSTTSFDGFTLYGSAGTVSGTLQVYGYN
jgi:hypothetical protein